MLVENFRPGALERLGLGPDVLHARNPGLVVTRVSGFGQDGPYAQRPGFATIAEAMSGLASISGEPDGQPLLPPIALTDEATGLAAAFATMVALRSGQGQVVDISLLETMFAFMGPLPSLYALKGEQQAAARRRAAVHRAAGHVPVRATAGGSPCRRAATPWRRGSWPCSASATTSASRRSPGGPPTATSWRP